LSHDRVKLTVSRIPEDLVHESFKNTEGLGIQARKIADARPEAMGPVIREELAKDGIKRTTELCIADAKATRQKFAQNAKIISRLQSAVMNGSSATVRIASTVAEQETMIAELYVKVDQLAEELRRTEHRTTVLENEVNIIKDQIASANSRVESVERAQDAAEMNPKRSDSHCVVC